MTAEIQSTVNKKRRAGVLLHPTSLPGELANGDLGHQSYRFIEFLQSAGFKVWQMLPIGPTHSDLSPYQCLSSHAGNPMLISLDWLDDRGWLRRDAISLDMSEPEYRYKCLHSACSGFIKANQKEWLERFELFNLEQRSWLDNFSLFMAIKNHQLHKPWYEWPKPLKNREKSALEKARTEYKDEITQICFEQFIFYTQWQEIRAYAKSHEIELFGDLPIFVARDSADVWSDRENFLVDEEGEMAFVAGVPPDAFSETGQRWGNPLFDWEFMKSDNFDWWKKRFRTQLMFFDIVRIDHFRGLQACWHIPANEDTAINGKWIEVPGADMLEALFAEFNQLPLIAEDLGVITDEVIALKNAFDLSGMKVLQFAFDGNSNNPHLPHRHLQNDVVYTGTHDNDTTVGWFSSPQNYNSDYFNHYSGGLNNNADDALATMIRLALSSVSFLAILPMQDLLKLGSEARMNIPGTTEKNWRWRFNWNQLEQNTASTFASHMTVYQR